jgi:hypothetical protein
MAGQRLDVGMQVNLTFKGFALPPARSAPPMSFVVDFGSRYRECCCALDFCGVLFKRREDLRPAA